MLHPRVRVLERSVHVGAPRTTTEICRCTERTTGMEPPFKMTWMEQSFVPKGGEIRPHWYVVFVRRTQLLLLQQYVRGCVSGLKGRGLKAEWAKACT